MTEDVERRISFHDAGILRISSEGLTIRLRIEGALVDRVFRDIELGIEGVESITRDDVSVSRFDMEKTDGEIMEIYVHDKMVGLVVQWDNYRLQETDTVAYGFWGAGIALSITHVGAVTPHYGPLPPDIA